MSTIEELDRLSNERFAKEGAAVMGLVAVMRELAVGLPDGSRLAVELAQHAKHLEWMASHGGPPTRDCVTASVAVMDAADALDHGEWDEVIERLDEALASLIPQNRLEELATAAGLASGDVAIRLGLDDPIVDGWFGGDRIPAEYRPALCRVFAVSEPFLMGEG